MTAERKRQIDKARIKAFLNGCELARCISSHCPHYFGDHADVDVLRPDNEAGLVNCLNLLKNDKLDISCVDTKAPLPPQFEEFAPILDFSYNKAFNMDREELTKTFQKFRDAAESLVKKSDEDRNAVAKLFEQRLSEEFESLVIAFAKQVPADLSFLVMQTVPMCWFMFEIESFSGFKVFRKLLEKISFDRMFSKQLKKLRQFLIFSPSLFSRSVENLQNNLTYTVLQTPRYFENPQSNSEFKSLCEALRFFESTNWLLPRPLQIPTGVFMNDSVSTETDVKIPLLLLLKGSLPRRLEMEVAARSQLNPRIHEFNFLNYPFLFSNVEKIDILKLESFLAQDSEIESSLLTSSFSLANIFSKEHIYLELILRREHLLEDSLNQLSSKANFSKLKKPLKIHFVGEPGVDEGGLTKEFFHLLVAKLFEPHFGMFELKNNRVWWFDHRSLEIPLNFQLVGVLLGLSLYNQTILELAFPMAVYKKLKITSGSTHYADQISIEDLKEIDPDVYTSLINTLKNDLSKGDSGLTFSVEYDNFGERKTHEFVPDGANTPVTEENKEKFVEMYLDWYFHNSIKAQFDPFSKGFFSVMSGKIIKMFTAHELYQAINGSEVLDFNELKKTTKYDDGYTENSETINHFWSVLLQFEESQKKDFLKFLTGSHRAPLRGLSEIKMVVSRFGSEKERIPASHTCYNHLLLPDYKNIEVLRKKLLYAIQHSEGFGLF